MKKHDIRFVSHRLLRIQPITNRALASLAPRRLLALPRMRRLSINCQFAETLNWRGRPRSSRARWCDSPDTASASRRNCPQASNSAWRSRALVVEPALLLLDEPLGALDKGLRQSMQVELRALQRRLGITTVMVTHDQDEALTMSDRIVIMRDGQIKQVGSPEDVYRHPISRFTASFLGASNFLRGRVTGNEQGVVSVAVPGGPSLAIRTNREVDRQITVALWPEAIAIAPDESGCQGTVPNTSPAMIEQVKAWREKFFAAMIANDGGDRPALWNTVRAIETLFHGERTRSPSTPRAKRGCAISRPITTRSCSAFSPTRPPPRGTGIPRPSRGSFCC